MLLAPANAGLISSWRDHARSGRDWPVNRRYRARTRSNPDPESGHSSVWRRLRSCELLPVGGLIRPISARFDFDAASHSRPPRPFCTVRAGTARAFWWNLTTYSDEGAKNRASGALRVRQAQTKRKNECSSMIVERLVKLQTSNERLAVLKRPSSRSGDRLMQARFSSSRGLSAIRTSPPRGKSHVRDPTP